jgi:hypothetical protein
MSTRQSETVSCVGKANVNSSRKSLTAGTLFILYAPARFRRGDFERVKKCANCRDDSVLKICGLYYVCHDMGLLGDCVVSIQFYPEKGSMPFLFCRSLLIFQGTNAKS